MFMVIEHLRSKAQKDGTAAALSHADDGADAISDAQSEKDGNSIAKANVGLTDENGNPVDDDAVIAAAAAAAGLIPISKRQSTA